MPWRNDPAVQAIPHVGQGSVDVGRRSQCGEAVIYDGSNPDALVAWLGDERLMSVNGKLFQQMADGTLVPQFNVSEPTIVFKPMAGDHLVVSAHEFTTDFAIVVHLDKPAEKKVSDNHPAKKAAVKKATVKKAAPPKK